MKCSLEILTHGPRYGTTVYLEIDHPLFSVNLSEEVVTKELPSEEIDAMFLLEREKYYEESEDKFYEELQYGLMRIANRLKHSTFSLKNVSIHHQIYQILNNAKERDMYYFYIADNSWSEKLRFELG